MSLSLTDCAGAPINRECAAQMSVYVVKRQAPQPVRWRHQVAVPMRVLVLYMCAAGRQREHMREIRARSIQARSERDPREIRRSILDSYGLYGDPRVERDPRFRRLSEIKTEIR